MDIKIIEGRVRLDNEAIMDNQAALFDALDLAYEEATTVKVSDSEMDFMFGPVWRALPGASRGGYDEC